LLLAQVQAVAQQKKLLALARPACRIDIL